MKTYIKAYKKLKEDYIKITESIDTLNHYSPVKKVRVLDSIHGVPAITLTKMHGEAVDGYYVDKTIIVNDEKCSTDDDVVLKDHNNHVAEDFHNVGLTRLRCGLMTSVAIEECMNLLGIKKIKRVGFIGNGKTNIQNTDCIHDIFKVNTFFIRGSKRNRSKNLEEFKKITGDASVDDTDDYRLLNECDVIVSCTSTCDPKDQISVKELNKPRIFIALDTGYLLDESFRKECEAYSDDITQLNAYYHEEFIFDKDKVKLKQLMKDKTVNKERICVYMFGISFADAEVAEMLYRHVVNIEDID